MVFLDGIREIRGFCSIFVGYWNFLGSRRIFKGLKSGREVRSVWFGFEGKKMVVEVLMVRIFLEGWLFGMIIFLD